MGDAFGPRPRASRRAMLRCLALSASVAIAGCGPDERELSDCHNALTGAWVVVYSDTRQMPLMYEDGSEGVIDASGPEWRCEPRPVK